MAHARGLIAAGKVDRAGSWSISAEDENAMLGNPPDWGAYSAMHLGHDAGANAQTKEAWKYPFGKAGKVYRSALIAIRSRAGQQHAAEIENAAGKLLEALDGKKRTDLAEQDERRIEIFRAGRHTAMSGEVIEFGAGDLRASASAYDPGIHEAPVVVGHPRTDDPAYGWVKALEYSDNGLFATVGQVDPEFAGLVRAGRFKKISSSFYAPDSPQNPAPGVYYLRHVGFLGAQPPAVKGLKPVSFAAGEEGMIEFDINISQRRDHRMTTKASEFHEGTGRRAGGILRRIREHILRKHGQDEADETVPREELERLEEEARREGESVRTEREEHAATHQPGYAEVSALQQKEADLKRREAEFAEREKAFADSRKAAVHDSHVDFCVQLVKDGKMLPASKDNAVAILDYAAGEGAPSLEFGEGTDRVKMVLSEAVKLLLANQPKAITYGEIVRPGDALPDDEDGMREAKVREYQEKHKDATYKEAMLEVSKEFPQLFGLAVKPKK
jgi:hypothetical protein